MTSGSFSILGVHPGSVINGGLLGCLEIAEFAREAGCTFFLATDGNGPASDLAEKRGIKVVPTRIPRWFCGFPGGSGFPDPRMISHFIRNYKSGVEVLADFINSEHVDVVLANTSPAVVGVLAGNKAQCPVLGHVRETMPYQSRWGRAHARFFSEKSQKIIVNSDSSARAFAGLKNWSKIYDGVDVPKGFSSQVKSICWREENGIATKRPVIGVLGGISKSKGHFLLFEFLSYLVSLVPDVLVVFMGDLPPQNKTTGIRGKIREMVTGDNFNISEIIKSAGAEHNVLFSGWINDPFAILAEIDVLAFPSVIPEGFGRPLVEAALMGKPVVAFNHGPSPEIVDPGVTGLLVSSGDGKAFIEALASLLLDDSVAKKLGANGRTKVIEKFSLRAHNEKILSELIALGKKKVSPDLAHGNSLLDLLVGEN